MYENISSGLKIKESLRKYRRIPKRGEVSNFKIIVKTEIVTIIVKTKGSFIYCLIIRSPPSGFLFPKTLLKCKTSALIRLFFVFSVRLQRLILICIRVFITQNAVIQNFCRINIK